MASGAGRSGELWCWCCCCCCWRISSNRALTDGIWSVSMLDVWDMAMVGEMRRSKGPGRCNGGLEPWELGRAWACDDAAPSTIYIRLAE